MTTILLLLPEIGLSLSGLLILIADTVVSRARSRWLYYLSIVSVVLALGSLQLFVSHAWQGGGDLWVVDPFSLYLKALVLCAALLTLFLSLDYPAVSGKNPGIFSALLLWATAGTMLLVSSVDFLLMFLALELISISSFILTGFTTQDPRSSEGAVKYFLIGAFSSALTVYGLSLFYGLTGTTHVLGAIGQWTRLGRAQASMLTMGVLFLLAGFGFKLSVVPFHFWVPDAYEGAPTPVTAYLSVAPKIATLGILLRIFTILIPRSTLDVTALFGALSVLTMTVGNLSALFQDNIKRLLAYSSIAQAGYMMIGLVAGGPLGQEGVFIYFLAYLFMNMGAFAVAIAVGRAGGLYSLSAFDGLGKRSLGLSLLMSCFLLSLAGIPPLAGFIGKFYVFASAIQGGYVWLAVVGVLNSVISVYYYMRVAYRMFFVEPVDPTPLAQDIFLSAGLSVAVAATFLVGLLPNSFIEAARSSIRFLP